MQKLYLSPSPRLVSRPRHGSDPRQHHLKQGRVASTSLLLQPVRRLHLTTAVVAGPERPPLEPRAPQPHARDGGHGVNGLHGLHGFYRRRHGVSGNGPGHDAAQPHGHALRRSLAHGGHRPLPFPGFWRRGASSTDFGGSRRSRGNDGGGGTDGRRGRHDGSQHQPFSSLRKFHHSSPSSVFTSPHRLPLSPHHLSPQHTRTHTHTPLVLLQHRTVCVQNRNWCTSIYLKKRIM